MVPQRPAGQRPAPVMRNPLLQPNVNVAAQQGGLGIIPTLFGLQNGNGEALGVGAPRDHVLLQWDHALPPPPLAPRVCRPGQPTPPRLCGGGRWALHPAAVARHVSGRRVPLLQPALVSCACPQATRGMQSP